MQFLWMLFQGLLAVLFFAASVLMLNRLWRLVPISLRSIIRNVAALVLFILGVLGSVLPIMPGFVFFLLALIVVDVPQKRAAMRRLQHHWLMQKLLQSQSFAQTWRSLRRYARKNSNAAQSQANRT
jgi:uncharacterized membrane protein YbaN (DUF454 family)